MLEAPEITFEGEVWLYSAPKASWHFVTVPVETSAQVQFYAPHVKAGWGSIPVQVRVGATTWKTSIFPDKKTKTYLLPLKAQVRATERLAVGTRTEVSLIVNP